MSKCMRFVWLLARGLLGLCRLLLVWICGFLCVVGLVAVTDLFRDVKIPPVRTLGFVYTPVTPPSPDEVSAMRECDKWLRCERPLLLLDRVCPEASAWVRWEYDHGLLLWSSRPNAGYYASFQPVPRILTIHSLALEAGDDMLASVLAHEFRHSRQFLLPSLQVIIAAAFFVDRSGLVEDEAYDYGFRVLRAIRGRQ